MYIVYVLKQCKFMCGSGCMLDDKESMKCKKGEIFLFIRVNGIILNGVLGVFVVYFFYWC